MAEACKYSEHVMLWTNARAVSEKCREYNLLSARPVLIDDHVFSTSGVCNPLYLDPGLCELKTSEKKSQRLLKESRPSRLKATSPAFTR